MIRQTRSWLLASAAILSWVVGPAPVLSQDINETYDCVIEPHKVVEVGSSADGVLESVEVKRGDLVQAGQTLATIKADVERVSVELARTKADNNVALESNSGRSEYFAGKLKRAEELYEKKVSSLDAVERARTESMLADYDYKKAKFEQEVASVELKRAEVVLAQKTIVAPMPGIVVSRSLSPGAFIYEQAKLLTLAQIDPLNVEVFVPIELYSQLSPGMSATVVPAAPFDREYDAKVQIIDKVFDAASATFGVRLKLPNPDRSLPAGLKCVVKFN